MSTIYFQVVLKKNSVYTHIYIQKHTHTYRLP